MKLNKQTVLANLLLTFFVQLVIITYNYVTGFIVVPNIGNYLTRLAIGTSFSFVFAVVFVYLDLKIINGLDKLFPIPQKLIARIPAELTSSNNLNNTRASNIITSAMYTTKKQLSIEVEYDLYFSNDDYHLYGYTSFSRFPSSFFGLGNFTNEQDEEVYTPKYYHLKNIFVKRIITKNKGGLYVGLRQEFRTDKILESEPDGKINNSQLVGSNGGTVVGLGINAIFDTRDNTFSSSEGKYAEVQLNFFNKFLFSDYNFTSLLIDLRDYESFTVFNSQTTMAIQFSTMFTKGNVPFYILPTIGGNKNMRGVYEGRYRNNNSFFMQAEHRFPIYWIIGMTVFAGTAQVAKDIMDYSIKGLKIAYGFGVRLNVIPDEKVILRADFGFSQGGSQIYLGFGEAF